MFPVVIILNAWRRRKLPSVKRSTNQCAVSMALNTKSMTMNVWGKRISNAEKMVNYYIKLNFLEISRIKKSFSWTFSFRGSSKLLLLHWCNWSATNIRTTIYSFIIYEYAMLYSQERNKRKRNKIVSFIKKMCIIKCILSIFPPPL